MNRANAVFQAAELSNCEALDADDRALGIFPDFEDRSRRRLCEDDVMTALRFYPSAAVVGKAQRLRPNIGSRPPRSASSSCKSGHQWIPPTNAQFESALQKARKQPGAAHVEILLGSKMVTPPPREVIPRRSALF